MQNHDKGPKDVLVRSYPRWKAGKREWVRSAFRASWYRLSLGDSKDQLVFGFYQTATG
jgi:hypothetical protein